MRKFMVLSLASLLLSGPALAFNCPPEQADFCQKVEQEADVLHLDAATYSRFMAAYGAYINGYNMLELPDPKDSPAYQRLRYAFDAGASVDKADVKTFKDLDKANKKKIAEYIGISLEYLDKTAEQVEAINRYVQLNHPERFNNQPQSKASSAMLEHVAVTEPETAFSGNLAAISMKASDNSNISHGDYFMVVFADKGTKQRWQKGVFGSLSQPTGAEVSCGAQCGDKR